MVIENLVAALQPFMSPQGEAFIRVTAEGEPPEDLPLDSQAAGDIVHTQLARLFGRRLPMAKDVRSALAALRGAAYEGNRQEPIRLAKSVLAELPLAKVILEIQKRGGTKGSAEHLLPTLNKLAVRQAVDITSRTWPSTADALGKQLSHLKPYLAEVGCELGYAGNLRPREWTIPPALRGERDVEVAAEKLSASTTSDSSDTWPQETIDNAESNGQALQLEIASLISETI